MPSYRHLPDPPDYDDLPSWETYVDNVYIRLLNATWNALHTRDVADLSLREISREVGVTAPAAYKCFRDKDALIGKLASISLSEFFSDIGRLAPGLLPHVSSQWVRFAQRRPRHYALMFSPQLEDRYPEVALRRNHLRSYLRELLEQELGFAPEKSEVQAFWALLHGAASLVAIGEPRQPNHALLEALEIYLAGLRKKHRS